MLASTRNRDDRHLLSSRFSFLSCFDRLVLNFINSNLTNLMSYIKIIKRVLISFTNDSVYDQGGYYV